MDDFQKVYNNSLKFLSYRFRSEKEVRDHFKIKNRRSKINTDETVIEKVIEKLKEQNFINDKEFAKEWIESRIRFKPRSLNLIKLELRKKGIDQELLDNLKFTVDDSENAKKLIEKKLGRFKNLPKEKIYQKLGRYLASKGFGWEIIKSVIDEELSKRV